MRFSIIIPVYNRPDEVEELLASLATQTFRDFEVIVVEDGSTVPCCDVVTRYQPCFDVRYIAKPNSGPGQSRNAGAKVAQGEYLIVLDSDVVLPADYLEHIVAELAQPCDAFGGPDRAHPSFSPLQKAINYAMTSFFTTGGIRGSERLDRFYPRSFNMGIRRSVYEALGGFSDMRFGEDIDFSIRIMAGGYSCRLFPSAWVFHKRRTSLRRFFKQVHNSGIARINLSLRHPGTLRLVHFLPAAFTLGVLALLLGAPFCLWSLSPIALYMLLVLVDASVRTNSPGIGARAVVASFVQLIGYGTGFLSAFWRRIILRKPEFSSFSKNFYK